MQRRFVPSYGAFDAEAITGLINAGATLVSATGGTISSVKQTQYQKALLEQQNVESRRAARQMALDARLQARAQQAQIAAQGRVAAVQAAQPWLTTSTAVLIATGLLLVGGALIYTGSKKKGK
jgi:hypothetical protein